MVRGEHVAGLKNKIFSTVVTYYVLFITILILLRGFFVKLSVNKKK